MKNTVLLILALAMIFGCTSGVDAGATAPDTAAGAASDATPEAMHESADVQPDTSVNTTDIAPELRGNVTLEVAFSQVNLETGTQQVREPNPDCYPDAQKCAMMDEGMHIYKEVLHEYYDLSSGADTCILSITNNEEDALFLVEYAIENQDSLTHSVSPEILVKTKNEKMGYLVSTPRSETNCTTFYDGSKLDISLGPSESIDLRAVIVLPKNESPLSAIVYVDGEPG